jgi:hypothetical protein
LFVLKLLKKKNRGSNNFGLLGQNSTFSTNFNPKIIKAYGELNNALIEKISIKFNHILVITNQGKKIKILLVFNYC